VIVALVDKLAGGEEIRQKRAMAKLPLLLVSALCACGVLVSSARGSIMMSIFDDGTNLTMTATGTYDLSGVAPVASFESDFNSAFVTPYFFGGLYGWSVGNNVLSYQVSFSASFTAGGALSTPPPTSLSTNTPFYFQYLSAGALSGPVIRFAQGTPNIGSVNETAFFANTTLADIGMVAGETVTVSWAGDSATIQTIGVPEPSTVLLAAAGVVALAVARCKLG